MSREKWIGASPVLSALLLAIAVGPLVSKERGLMNQYGVILQEHWRTARPKAFAELSDPVAFFTRAGEEVAVAIADLTPRLAGADLPGEETLEKVARLANARSRATEIALSESGLWGPGELTREEWEGSTQDHLEALIDWAWRMQDQLAGEQNHDLTFGEAAERFLLPVEFLEQMTEASSPRRFLQVPENWAQWLESMELRFVRDSSTH